MSFSSAADLSAALYALLVMLVYVLRSGYFVYPASALVFAMIFEALGWHGWGSAFVVLSIAGWIGLGITLRRLSHREWISSTDPDPAKAILICMGLFAVAFIPLLVLAAVLPTE
jgi:hypothetical protein